MRDGLKCYSKGIVYLINWLHWMEFPDWTYLRPDVVKLIYKYILWVYTNEDLLLVISYLLYNKTSKINYFYHTDFH